MASKRWNRVTVRLATQLRVDLVAGPTHSCLDPPSAVVGDTIGEATLIQSDAHDPTS